MTPMESWIWRNGPPGADRAWDEIGLEAPVMFSRFQLLGPFMYVRRTLARAEQMMAIVPRSLAVAKEHGGALALWENYCRPRIERSCHELAKMDATIDLREAAELLFYGFHQTFTSLAQLFIPSMRLSALLTDFKGPDTGLTALEWTQGGANATQATDEEVGDLAELARAPPAVSAVLRSTD